MSDECVPAAFAELPRMRAELRRLTALADAGRKLAAVVKDCIVFAPVGSLGTLRWRFTTDHAAKLIGEALAAFLVLDPPPKEPQA